MVIHPAVDCYYLSNPNGKKLTSNIHINEIIQLQNCEHSRELKIQIWLEVQLNKQFGKQL